MRTRIVLTLFLSLAITVSPAQQTNDAKSASELINRVIGAKSSHFITETIEYGADGKDFFEIDRRKNKILLRGTNGVAIASAFNYYLRHFANCQVTWNGNNLNLPDPLPRPPEKIVKNTPYQYRYYFNFCTFNYSASWWNWERWEKEIDWMALNGINTPLAAVGLNETLYQLYTGMGLKDEDLQDFFSGPAYFAWFWMGNLDGWGGPLPRSWMKSHYELQKKILARQRSLGMKPVLPAFSGHVPPRFKERFPDANLKSVGWNGIFPNINIIDPGDDLFVDVGKKFLEIQTRLYGTDHLYAADTFNEVDPPTNDSVFIDGVSKKVYQSMAAYDPEAIWVMQGWLFYFSRKFWKEPQIKALLNAVPDDKMVLLDLWTEKFPVWSKINAYYGKPWIWNMLNNFGGNNVMHGLMDSVANNPARDLKHPVARNLVGLGLTMEAIETNPVVYEMMMENVWQTEPVQIDEWLRGYARRRYGADNKYMNKAWHILKRTAYSDSLTSRGPRSMIQSRPTFSDTGIRIDLRFPYQNKELASAWENFILAAPQLKNSEGFLFDIVDITRQVLSNHAIVAHRQFTGAFNRKDVNAFRKYSREFLQLIDDMDELVGTHSNFLLGKWLADAKMWGTTAQEKVLYEKNARNLITTWGDKDNRLHEYSARQWSGLLKGFYKPRWQKFFAAAEESLIQNKKFDQEAFIKEIKEWEWDWVNGQELYRQQARRGPVEACFKMFRKYYHKVLTASETGKPALVHLANTP